MDVVPEVQCNLSVISLDVSRTMLCKQNYLMINAMKLMVKLVWSHSPSISCANSAK